MKEKKKRYCITVTNKTELEQVNVVTELQALV